jgi:hypothetical protein
MNSHLDPIFREIFEPYLKPIPTKSHIVTCGMTGKEIPPEDAGGCNNAEGCDHCVHNDGDE